MSQIRSLGALLGIAALGLVAAGCGGSNNAAGNTAAGNQGAAKPIEIGVSASLTGKYAFVGNDGVNGMKIAAQDINDAGGVNGRQIHLTIEDDASSPSQAIPLLSKFASDSSVLLTMNVSGSELAVPLAGVANQQKVFMGSPGGTSPKIAEAGPWSMSMSAGPTDLMEPVAKYAVSHAGDRLASVNVSDNDAYVALAQLFRDFAQKDGATITSKQSILTTTQDLSSVASKVGSTNADGVFLGVLPSQAATFVSEFHKAGKSNVDFYGPLGLATKDFLTAGGSDINGFIVGANYDPSLTAEGKKFAESYKAKFGDTPGDFAAIGFAAIKYTAQRLGQSHNVGGHTRAEVKTLLTAPGENSTILGNGTITLDEKRQLHYPAALLMAMDGKFVSAPK